MPFMCARHDEQTILASDIVQWDKCKVLTTEGSCVADSDCQWPLFMDEAQNFCMPNIEGISAGCYTMGETTTCVPYYCAELTSSNPAPGAGVDWCS